MTKDNLIDGHWVGSNDYRKNINPSDTSDIVGHFACGDEQLLNDAVEAAHRARDTWRASTPQARHDLLDAVGNVLLSRKNGIGRTLSREEGKTLAEGIGETARAGQIFKFFAGEALRQGGELLPSVRSQIDVEITREPVGVVGLITPRHWLTATAWFSNLRTWFLLLHIS